jgi:hypothetical protein
MMMCFRTAGGVMVARHLHTVAMGRGSRLLLMMVGGRAKHSGRAHRCLERHREEQHDQYQPAKPLHQISLTETVISRPDHFQGLKFRPSCS